MRTQTKFHKRVGGALVIAVLALAIAVPAFAGADGGGRWRDRSIDREWPSRESVRPDREDEDASPRPPVLEPLGVEWTF